MRKPKVFVSRIIMEKALDMIRDQCDLDLWTDELPPPKDILLERVRGCQGILTLLTDPIDEALLESAGPGLKVISNHAVGYDNIDVAAATRRGIPVGNTPGILTETTADFAFALLMASARRLREGWELAAWRGCLRRHARHHRVWTHRSSYGAPCRRLRNAHPLS